MLTQIKLKNFKIFKEETAFPLAKINLLTGINGRGKSSLLQSLLLMRQSLEIDENTEKLYLNGSCVRLGELGDVRNDVIGINEHTTFEFNFSLNGSFLKYSFQNYERDIKKMTIDTIEFNRTYPEIDKIFYYFAKIGEYSHSKKTSFRINKAAGYEDNKVQELKIGEDYLLRNFHINNPNKPTPFSKVPYVVDFDTIHYISADRIGPKDFYLKENLGKFINVGAKGEATANVLSHYKDEVVHDKLYKGEDAQNLLQQTEEWLKYILGNAKFTIDDTSREVIYLLFNTQGTSPKYKPSNVGFGYSYILPIIVSGLIAREGEILIVENPEAHLHPRAQSRLTEFLAIVASCGVQVFVETHSEHILHGLQIAVINQDIDISNEDVSVLYFHEKENGYFTQIPIKPNGDLGEWVDGFFDQANKDLSRIYGF